MEDNKVEIIKVAYIINYIKKGGPSNVVLGLLMNINRKYYEPTLITLFKENDYDIVQQIRRCGIEVIECKNNSRIKYLVTGQKEFASIVNKFDIIHTHGFIPDVISAYLNILPKKINTIHNNIFEDYVNEYGKIKGKIFIYIHKTALHSIDLCVCCSKSVYDAIKIYLKNVMYIENGSESPKFTKCYKRVEFGIPKDAIVFIYVGRLEEGKNVVSLIENFCKYRSDKEYLLIIGEGSQIRSCKEKSCNSVFFTGFVDNPLDYMKMADIYISASLSEGFSISVIEALGCGLGLFLSDIASHREVFNINNQFYLGELFHDDTFKNQLQILRENITKINKEKIKKFKDIYLSAKRMSEKYEKMYVTLLSDNKRSFNGKS